MARAQPCHGDEHSAWRPLRVHHGTHEKTVNSPSPAIRCLSCGYDVASLIAQRGRDEPGVCPECGADLRPSLVERPGLEVQHTWSTPSYLRFLRGAFAGPLRTADSMHTELGENGTLVFLNCVMAAGITFVGVSVVGGVIALANGSLLGAFGGVAAGIAASLLFATVLALTSGLLSVGVAGIASMAGLRPTYNAVCASMDIATVWFVPWPVFLVAGGLFAASTTPAVAMWSILLFWGAPLGIVPIVALCVMIRLRRPPASKHPSPANLELP